MDWPAFFDDTEGTRPDPKLLFLASRLGKDRVGSLSKA